MPDAVIELDSDEADEAVAARHRAGSSLRRWAVLAGAALVLLGISGPPGPAGVTLVSLFADPSGGQGVGALADDVFVVEEPGGVAAYELDGRKRWSAGAQLPATRQDPIRVLGELVVISGQTDGAGEAVTAFDAVSGARRWQLDGRLLQMRDGLIAVQDDQILRVYDAEPLRLRWEIGDVTAAAVDHQTRSMVALFTDATIAKLDLDSGVKRMSSRIARAVGGHVSIFVEPGLVSIYASWTPTGPLETQFLSADTLRPAEAMPLDNGDREIVDLTGWTPLPQKGWSATAPVTLLTRAAPGDGTVVARVRGNRPQVLGTLPFEIDHCTYHAPILVCSIPVQRLAVWRIDPDR